MKRSPLVWAIVSGLAGLALLMTLGDLALAQIGPDQATPATQTAVMPTVLATGGPTPTVDGLGRRQSYIWVSTAPESVVPYENEAATEFPDGTTLIYINFWFFNEIQTADYRIEIRNGFGATQAPRLEGRYDPAAGVMTVPWSPGSGSIPRAANDYIARLFIKRNISGTEFWQEQDQDEWRIGSNLRFSAGDYTDTGPASLEVVDEGRNQNSNAQESLTVKVWSVNGDPTGFNVTLKESSAASGRFTMGPAVGISLLTFCTEAGCTDASASRLNVNPQGDRIQASYVSAGGQTLTAQADWFPSGGGGTPRPTITVGPPSSTPTRTPTLPGNATQVTLTPVPTTIVFGVNAPRVGYIQGPRSSGVPSIHFSESPDIFVGYREAAQPEPIYIGFIQFDYTLPVNAQIVNADLALTGQGAYNTAELVGPNGQWRLEIIDMGTKTLNFTTVFSDVAGADTMATLSPILGPSQLGSNTQNRLFFGPEALSAMQSTFEGQRRVVFRVVGPQSVSLRESDLFSWSTGWATNQPWNVAGPRLRLDYVLQQPTGTTTATSAVSATPTATLTPTASATASPTPAMATNTPTMTPTAESPKTPTVTVTLTVTPTPSATSTSPPVATHTPTVTTTPPPNTFIVLGIVEDCSGQPINGAQVYILDRGYTTITQDGLYIMQQVGLDEGTYTFLALKGTASRLRDVILRPSQPQNRVDFTDEFCVPVVATTPSVTRTLTATVSPSPTSAPVSATPTPTTEDIATHTPTATLPPLTPSPTPTLEVVLTTTPTATGTVTTTSTATTTSTPTLTRTVTPTPTETATNTVTRTPTVTQTPTATLTPTHTATPTPTITPTRTLSVFFDKPVYATLTDRIRMKVFDMGRWSTPTQYTASIALYSDASLIPIRLNLYRDDTTPGIYMASANELVGFCDECFETDTVNLQLKVRVTGTTSIRAEYTGSDQALYTATVRWQLNPPPTETLTPTVTATRTPTLSPTPTATPEVVPTSTPTATLEASRTPTPTVTATPEVIATSTATPTATPGVVATFTSTPTATSEVPVTLTPSPTVTLGPTRTPTVTPPPLSFKTYLPYIAAASTRREQTAAPDFGRLPADLTMLFRRFWAALPFPDA